MDVRKKKISFGHISITTPLNDLLFYLISTRFPYKVLEEIGTDKSLLKLNSKLSPEKSKIKIRLSFYT